MSRFEWSEQYSVGSRVIDSDHRGLFDAMNDLQDAVEQHRGEDRINHTITYLIQYVHEHFGREEEMMRRSGYPDLEAHIKEHRKLTRQVYAVKKIYETDHKQVELVGLVEFLRGWLIRHILGRDADYIPYVDPYVGDDTKSLPVDETPSPGRMESVVVEVPGSHVEIIEKCAATLRNGGAQMQQLQALVNPDSVMTMAEARDIADFVLSH